MAATFWPVFLACGTLLHGKMNKDHSNYLLKFPCIASVIKDFTSNLGETLTEDQRENYTHFTEWRI